MSNSTIIVNELSGSELQMESCPTPPSLAMSEHSSVKGTPQHIRDWLMSSQAAFPANPSALPASEREPTTLATCGPPPSQPFAQYDPATHSWKMCQGFLLLDISEPSWETWPKAGMTHDGASYRQPSWERRTSEIASGLLPTITVSNASYTSQASKDKYGSGMTLTEAVQRSVIWPTPTAHDSEAGTVFTPVMTKNGTLRHMAKSGKTSRANLGKIAKFLATPTTRDYRSPNTNGNMPDQLPNQVGGQLNPTWVEWLMGWPLGWTDLKPLAMDKFQSWLQQHGIYCRKN